MLGMLIAVFGLDRIAVQSGFARKGEVALVISLRIARRCRLTPLATLGRPLRTPSFWTLRPWARSMHRLNLRELQGAQYTRSATRATISAELAGLVKTGTCGQALSMAASAFPV